MDVHEIYEQVIQTLSRDVLAETPDGVTARSIIEGYVLRNHYVSSLAGEPLIHLEFFNASSGETAEVGVRPNRIAKAVLGEPMLRHPGVPESDDVVAYLVVLVKETVESGSGAGEDVFLVDN